MKAEQQLEQSIREQEMERKRLVQKELL